MNKWQANEQARSNIARKWEIVELREELKIKPKQAENPHDYAHRVWWYNRARDWMTADAVKPFQAAVEMFIEELEEKEDYQALLNGTASDELIEDTRVAYYLGRKCKR